MIGFTLDKDAVLALKAPIRIVIPNQESITTFLVEPSSAFKKYLTDLSSSLKLKSSMEIPQKTETIKPKEALIDQSKNLLNKNKNTMEVENPQKVVIKGLKKKDVPLEIIKTSKSTNNKTQDKKNSEKLLQIYKKTNSRSRSRSATVEREKRPSFKKRSRRKMTEDLSRDSRRERRKESYDSYQIEKNRRRYSFNEKAFNERRAREKERENYQKNFASIGNSKGKILNKVIEFILFNISIYENFLYLFDNFLSNETKESFHENIPMFFSKQTKKVSSFTRQI